MRAIVSAPTSPVTWVFAPACSATAVREPLVLTGKPWKKPAAMFAAPIPTISWLPSTSWPVRSAKADAVEIVSARATRAMPRAPPISSGRSEVLISGSVSGGKPCGSVPTSATPWFARSNRLVARIEATTATRMAGIFGRNRWRTQDHGESEDADGERGGHRLAVGDTVNECSRLCAQAVCIDGEPEQLRQLTDHDRDRQAVHVADHGRLREQVRDESQSERASDGHEGTDEQREHRGESDRAFRVATGGEKREDRGGDHRPERRVRAEHEDPGRPEDRVSEQAEDRRVQAGDRWEAGQLGVRHPLWDEERRQDQTRDHVVRGPADPVRREHPEAGQHRPSPGATRHGANAASRHRLEKGARHRRPARRARGRPPDAKALR